MLAVRDPPGNAQTGPEGLSQKWSFPIARRSGTVGAMAAGVVGAMMKSSRGGGRRPAVLAVVMMLTLALAVDGGAAEEPYGAAVWNGQAAQADQIAAVVTPGGRLCSGVLIAPRWVLTAGHCLDRVPAARVRVGLGGTTFDEGFDEVHVVRMHAAHSLYNGATGQYDFGLIRLAQATQIAPLRIATGADGPLWQPDTPGVILGWGAIDGNGNGVGTLRAGDVAIAPDDVCGDVYGPRYDPSVMLCGDATEADGCSGDSGGPLLVNDGQVWLVMGITAFGERCDFARVGVYSFVPAAQRWINDTIASGRVPRVESKLRFAFSKSSIRRGNSLRISAWLFRCRTDVGDARCPADARQELRQQQIQLLSRPAGTSQRFKVAAAKVTGAKGRVVFRQSPKRDMVYRLRHRRTAVTTKRRSDAITVRVRR